MEIYNPAGDTAVSGKTRKRRRGKRKAASQIVDQMDVNLEASKIRGDGEITKNSLGEDNFGAKRKLKRNTVKSKAGNKDKVKSRDQLNSMSYLQLSDKSLRHEIDDKLVNESVQHTDQDMIDIETVNLTQGNMNQRMGQSHSMSKLHSSDSNLRPENCDKLAENVDVQHTDQNKVDTESIVNLTESNVSIKGKRKRRRIKRKTGDKDKLQSLGQSKNSASSLQSDNNLNQEIDNKLNENEDVRSTDQKKMDIESTYNLAEGNMSMKTKRRKEKANSKDKNKDKVQSMDLDPANGISNLQLSENNTERAIDGKLIEKDRTAQEFNFPAKIDFKPRHSDHLVDMVEVSIISASSEVHEERSVPFAGPVRLEGKVFPCESQQKPAHNQIPMEDVKFQNVLNEVNHGLFVVEGTTSLGSLGVKEAESLSKDLVEYPSKPPITTDRRKLLVLDVNGLLAYIVMPPPKGSKADINILRRAVFKRPFCDDFLKFCFQNFDIGIWSSRAKEVIDRIVDYLLGNLQPKLLFCWNMSQSTQSGFKTLENIHKPLVCKELRKIWENDGCKFSWKKGRYNESNTLLIDDSPYKALLNPLHTAIFPHPYHYEDKDDNSLGPGGDLRVYLEGLLKSENVQEYVEHHPFGQSAINETNVSWQFYSGVLQKFSDDTQATNNPTPVVTSSQSVTSPPLDKVLDPERTAIAHSTATPIKTIDPEVHPIHSSLVVSASQ
ncbi:uncharacterized protein [Primulina eburnea]|uniref:uncharacterized protein isoform X1 n=1 Tax=Primulina eburnea TaxID=1245227 RepID=UPI003C6C0EFE